MKIVDEGTDPKTASVQAALVELEKAALNALPDELWARLSGWTELVQRYDEPEQTYAVRGRDIVAKNYVETLSGTKVLELRSLESPVGVIEYVFSEARMCRVPFLSRLVFFRSSGQKNLPHECSPVKVV